MSDKSRVHKGDKGILGYDPTKTRQTPEQLKCPHCWFSHHAKNMLTKHINENHPEMIEKKLTLADRFLGKYHRLDKSIKRQIILEFNGQPFTWNPIWIEVVNDTKISKAMLKQLAAEGKI